MKKIISYGSSAVLSLAIASCANLPEITQMQPTALNYNKVVSGLKNELILLNIARASKRQPMHFTRITGITNSTTMTGTASVGASIPEKSRSVMNTSDGKAELNSVVESIGSTADTVMPSIGGSVALNPVFTYEVLDSKSFYNGILTPLSEDRFLLYQSQGWSTNFLAMLMVEKITFSCGKEVQDCQDIVYDNNPDEIDDIKLFRSFIENVSFTPKSKKVNPSKDFKISSVLDGKDLSTLADVLAKPMWSAKSQNAVSYTTGGGTGIEVDFSGITELEQFQEKQIASCSRQPTNGIKSTSIAQSTIEQEVLGIKSLPVGTCKTELDVKITFRSTNGILYYLGECTRQNESQCYYEISGKRNYVSRIQTSSNENHILKKDSLRTSFDGHEYWVPNPNCLKINNEVDCDVKNNKEMVDRTYSSISFVNQLLNLQQDEKEAPRTTTVIGLN